MTAQVVSIWCNKNTVGSSWTPR